LGTYRIGISLGAGDTITKADTFVGAAADGVDLEAGGTLTNAALSTVSGGPSGILHGACAAVFNAGVIIRSTTYGVDLGAAAHWPTPPRARPVAAFPTATPQWRSTMPAASWAEAPMASSWVQPARSQTQPQAPSAVPPAASTAAPMWLFTHASNIAGVTADRFFLGAAGIVTTPASGTISGAAYGIFDGAAGVVVNADEITGRRDDCIAFASYRAECSSACRYSAALDGTL
jgi:hypothetical protein